MTKDSYIIAIIGLGLMGGSFAYALRGFKDSAIVGFDTDADTMRLSLQCGAIDRAAASLEEAVAGADLVLFCSSPNSIIENMKICLDLCKKGSVVTDICGVKNDILEFVTEYLPSHVDYVGLHPMAGKEVGGFANADKELFRDKGFILILSDTHKQGSVDLLRELSFYVGAGRVVANRASEHDALIAYTSDLMHISAAALCADYPENMTMAHTAGAFRDCTRVARIDADLWSDLLTKNADNIILHLETYIQNLAEFKAALERGDKDFIHAFLQKSSDNKEKILTS